MELPQIPRKYLAAASTTTLSMLAGQGVIAKSSLFDIENCK